MTLDERVRTGLHASAGTRRLDEDRAFDDVMRTRDQRVARARIMRQAGAAIVVAVIFAGVAVFISWRTMPDRHQVVATSPQLDPNERIRVELHALESQATKLHRNLHRVDTQLAKLDPVKYSGVLRFDGPRTLFPGAHTPAPPRVPERGTVRELNLAFERIQILNTLEGLSRQASALRTQAAQPQLIPPAAVSQTPARKVAQTPPATVPALVALALAVVLILGGAFFLYRRRIRDSGRHA